MVYEERRNIQPIPTLKTNLTSLKKAYDFSTSSFLPVAHDSAEEEIIFSQAKTLIESTLNLDSNISISLYKAFKSGFLDVPFCLHPDNRRLTSCAIDNNGYLQWISTGNLPLKPIKSSINLPSLTSQQFLKMLAFNRQKFDSL